MGGSTRRAGQTRDFGVDGLEQHKSAPGSFATQTHRDAHPDGSEEASRGGYVLNHTPPQYTPERALLGPGVRPRRRRYGQGPTGPAGPQVRGTGGGAGTFKWQDPNSGEGRVGARSLDEGRLGRRPWAVPNSARIITGPIRGAGLDWTKGRLGGSTEPLRALVRKRVGLNLGSSWSTPAVEGPGPATLQGRLGWPTTTEPPRPSLLSLSH